MDSRMWDARYEEVDLLWSKEPNLFLPLLVEDLKTGTALDLACGEGRNALWLARNGWSVTGVDFSPVAIKKARAIARNTEVNWLVDDVTAVDTATQFDLVIMFYIQLPPDDLARAFQRAVASLAPGGTLVGVGHAIRNLEDGYGGPQYPERLWTEELVAPLVLDLDVLELGERERPVPEADVAAIDLVVKARRPV
ncbi:MAG: class I SAM-dependent methyltransferase [Acidimicrobiia bacterium]